jgi:hypothetical protein
VLLSEVAPIGPSIAKKLAAEIPPEPKTMQITMIGSGQGISLLLIRLPQRDTRGSVEAWAAETGDYPRNLGEFDRRFHDDDACLRHLVETRWPAGFRCPKCEGRDGRLLTTRRVRVCRCCRHHTSATARAVLPRTRLRLTTRFVAAYLVASLKPSVSALQLQAQLGISRYQTAWLLPRKLRRAMGDRDRKNRKALMVRSNGARSRSDGYVSKSSPTTRRPRSEPSSPATSNPASRS